MQMIRDELAARGWSRYELAKHVKGCSQATVYNVCDGKPVTLTAVIAVLEALGIELVFELTAKGKRTRPEDLI